MFRIHLPPFILGVRNSCYRTVHCRLWQVFLLVSVMKSAKLIVSSLGYLTLVKLPVIDSLLTASSWNLKGVHSWCRLGELEYVCLGGIHYWKGHRQVIKRHFSLEIKIKSSQFNMLNPFLYTLALALQKSANCLAQLFVPVGLPFLHVLPVMR